MNGVLAAQTLLADQLSPSDFPLITGNWHFGSRPLAGRVWEVQVSKEALTPEEVKRRGGLLPHSKPMLTAVQKRDRISLVRAAARGVRPLLPTESGSAPLLNRSFATDVFPQLTARRRGVSARLSRASRLAP